MRIHVRYETPNKEGQTRRERNESADILTPPLEIPEAGEFLWDIYFKMSNAIPRIIEGSYQLFRPADVQAWLNLMGELVYPTEYDILCEMDRVYCEEANKELEDIREREREERERENKARNGG